MLIVLRALEPIKTPRRGAKSAGVPEPTCAEAGKGGRRTRRGQLRTPVTPARRKVGTSGGQWVRSGRTSDERAEPPLETLMCAYRRVAQGISRVTSRPGRARHTCGRLRWTSRGRISPAGAFFIHGRSRSKKMSKAPRGLRDVETLRRGRAHTTARATMSAPTRARVASRAYGAPPRARTRAPTSRVARGARPLTTRRRVVLRRVAPVDSGEDVDVTAEPSAADAWRIRPADPDDIPAVVAAAAVSGVDWSPSQIAEEQARGALLVAVPAADTATDTPIAGLVVAWVVADVEVQILEVAVHPTLRRRGLGARLVRAALDLAPAVDATLEVRASNDAALRLYESCGFSRVGERAGYYADEEDAVLMTRTPPVVSARELTRLLAGLSPEDARKPAPKTPEEKQRGETIHPQDYPRGRPAFRRDATGTGGGAGGGFKMRNRARGGFRRKTANPETET